MDEHWAEWWSRRSDRCRNMWVTNRETGTGMRLTKRLSKRGVRFVSPGLLQFIAVRTARQTVLFEKYSQSRMPPHVSSPELDDATILRPCFIRQLRHSFLSDDWKNTRSHVLFTTRCQARRLRTRRMTSTLSPTVVVVCSDPLPPGHASSHER